MRDRPEDVAAAHPAWPLSRTPAPIQRLRAQWKKKGRSPDKHHSGITQDGS
jgi:hypothetical protein